MASVIPDFHVGSVPVFGKLILAPMDGFNDVPFRLICRQHGSAMSYVPFISARDLLQGLNSTWDDLRFDPKERPVVIQLFDSEASRLLDAALRLESMTPDVIDINMGCSSMRVSRRGAGAGLLLDPRKISCIIDRLSAKLDVPVTAKIRLGWDWENLNYLEIARTIEEHGGAMIAVHGRTRHQAFTGKADWDAIAEIKQAVSIPVVGNGDVKTPADVRRFLSHTRCDGVMIGRAAIGNPWIFQYRSRQDVSAQEASTVIHDHFHRMVAEYGEKLGLIRFRKHLVRYLGDTPLADKSRLQSLTAEDYETFLKCLSQAGYPSPH